MDWECKNYKINGLNDLLSQIQSHSDLFKCKQTIFKLTVWSDLVKTQDLTNSNQEDRDVYYVALYVIFHIQGVE